MAEKIDRADAVETSPEKDVGAGEGGPDASGAGNILAGMQPSTEEESGTQRRHDSFPTVGNGGKSQRSWLSLLPRRLIPEAKGRSRLD